MRYIERYLVPSPASWQSDAMKTKEERKFSHLCVDKHLSKHEIMHVKFNALSFLLAQRFNNIARIKKIKCF